MLNGLPVAASLNQLDFSGIQGHTSQSAKTVLVASDIDETFISWQDKYDLSKGPKSGVLEKQQAFFEQEQVKEHSELFLTTGRGLTDLKRVAHYLKPFDLYGVGTANGQQLFMNTHIDGQDTEEWIDSLKAPQSNQDWQTIQGGWNLVHAVRDNEQTFKTLGYHPIQVKQKTDTFFNSKDARAFNNDTVHTRIEFFPDQAYFRVSADHSYNLDDNVINQEAKRIETHLAQSLTPQTDLPIHTFIQYRPGEAFIHFGPEGINKGEQVQYVLSTYMPNAQALITAGDSPNDESMLTKQGYQNALDKPVAHYPTQVGEEPNLTEKLTDCSPPQLERVKHGALTKGLSAQWEKIATWFDQVA